MPQQTYTVSGVNSSGSDRVIVNLGTPAESAPGGVIISNNLTLNLGADEAETGGYFPGNRFVVTVDREPVAPVAAKKS